MGTVLSGIKVTLYDLFGYLLPGIVSLLGAVVLFWTFFRHDASFVIAPLGVEGWALILLAAYFGGHLTQALGNLLEKLLGSPEGRELHHHADGTLSALLDLAESKAAVVVRGESDKANVSGISSDEPEHLRREWLYSICDETVVQCGNTQDREVYIYREGFYRGLAVAFSFLTLSIIVRTVRTRVFGEVSVELPSTTLNIGWPMLLFFVVISVVGAVLAFVRYRRFGHYRVTRAIVGFLVLQGTQRPDNKENETG